MAIGWNVVIDKQLVEAVDKYLEKLGICYNHFMFDQNKLHSSSIKKTKNSSESIIHNRRCKFCEINYYFFSNKILLKVLKSI